MLVYNKILLYLHSHIPNLQDLPFKKMIPRFVYQMDDYFFFPPSGSLICLNAPRSFHINVRGTF